MSRPCREGDVAAAGTIQVHGDALSDFYGIKVAELKIALGVDYLCVT